MIVSAGSIIMTCIELVILFVILFTFSWIISKKVKKNLLLTFICVWCLLFLFNFFMVILDIPFIIGIPNEMSMNGKDGKYISFGYAIKIEGHNAFEKSNYNVYFTNIF